MAPEALDLEEIRERIGPRGGSVKRGFRRRTPEYVRFEQAPIIEAAGPITIPAPAKSQLLVEVLRLRRGDRAGGRAV